MCNRRSQAPKGDCHSLLYIYWTSHDCIVLMQERMQPLTKVVKCLSAHAKIFYPILRCKCSQDNKIPPMIRPTQNAWLKKTLTVYYKQQIAYLGSVQTLLVVCDDRSVSAKITMHNWFLLMVNLCLRACKRLRMVVVRRTRLILRELSSLSDSRVDRRAISIHRFLLLHDISNQRTPDVAGRRSPIPVSE